MVDLRRINRLARHIATIFHPDRIILFGSRAYGTPTNDSDVDLLVVMATNGDVVEKAAEIYVSVDQANVAPFSIDVLVRTPEQIQERIALNDFFIREIVEKGKVLYESADSRVGRKSRKGFPQRVA